MSMDLTERLIGLVQQHPCLYDRRVKNNKNTATKDKLWQMIANELKQSSETIKMKWKNLKDGYAKYRKSIDGNGTAKDAKYGNWVWGSYLSFLEGATMLRSKHDEGTDTSNSAVIGTEIISSYKSEDSEDMDPSGNANESYIHEFLQLSSRHSRKRRASNHEEYPTKDRVPDYHNIEVKDSVDLLFESYAKSLKQLKPRTQAAIKVKLAQMFAEAELEDFTSIKEAESSMSVASVECNQNALFTLSAIESNENYDPSSPTYEHVKKETNDQN